MKIGIEIRKEFEKIFNDVVQKNGGKPGTVARLIIESQLSFFLSRNVLPNFFQSVNFTLENKKEQKQQQETKPLNKEKKMYTSLKEKFGDQLKEILASRNLLIPFGIKIPELLKKYNVERYDDLPEEIQDHMEKYTLLEYPYDIYKDIIIS